MITLKGRAQTYQLQWGTNAFCRLEELTGRPYEDVLRELKGNRSRPVTRRAFLAAALVEPADPTDRELGRILRDIGGRSVIRAAVRGALADEHI